MSGDKAIRNMLLILAEFRLTSNWLPQIAYISCVFAKTHRYIPILHRKSTLLVAKHVKYISVNKSYKNSCIFTFFWVRNNSILDLQTTFPPDWCHYYLALWGEPLLILFLLWLDLTYFSASVNWNLLQFMEEIWEQGYEKMYTDLHLFQTILVKTFVIRLQKWPELTGRKKSNLIFSISL